MAAQFQLVMRTGPTPGKVFELTQPDMTIGRDIGNPIVVNDPEVSRKHTRLRAQAGGYVVEDLGSTNGTFVNGQRLTGPHMLQHGELIMMGEHVGFAYEALQPQFDPNATMVSGAGQQETFKVAQPAQTVQAPTPVEYQPAYQQPAYQQPAYQQPAYSGQVPAEPEPYVQQPYEAYAAPAEEPAPAPRSKMRWIFIGCGAIIVLLCVCVAAVYAFDALDLYCSGPFKSIMEALGFVCN